MGQQQLLLIVLGVIIVGIAVVVGINVFTASSLTANNDALIADLQTIGSMAQQYYRKPAAMGGGGQDFTGFVIPPALIRTANMSADVTQVITGGAGGNIVFTATGTSKINDGTTDLSVSVTVTSNNISVTSTNVND